MKYMILELSPDTLHSGSSDN